MALASKRLFSITLHIEQYVLGFDILQVRLVAGVSQLCGAHPGVMSNEPLPVLRSTAISVNDRLEWSRKSRDCSSYTI